MQGNTQITDAMVEAAANAIDRCVLPNGDEFGVMVALSGNCDGEYTIQDICNLIARAALSAALAGHVVVPKEATAEMIAAAFPATDRDVLSTDDLKVGAAAIMILEGAANLGSITGPAVREAASMRKNYRAMISAAPPAQREG